MTQELSLPQTFEATKSFSDQMVLADELLFRMEKKLRKKGVSFFAYYVMLSNCYKSARETIAKNHPDDLVRLDKLSDSILAEVVKRRTY